MIGQKRGVRRIDDGLLCFWWLRGLDVEDRLTRNRSEVAEYIPVNLAESGLKVTHVTFEV